MIAVNRKRDGIKRINTKKKENKNHILQSELKRYPIHFMRQR
jgi:hypothetical protein